MDCPVCGGVLPEVTDPTQREATCPSCGESVDLAVVAESTREVDLPPADPLLDRVVGTGRYRIDERLGQGGMGTVYRGTQINLGRPVAIKVLAPELTRDDTFVRRFRREAGTLAAFQHPHVVTVHDTGEEEDGIHFIVMAYVSGPSGRPMSLRDLVKWGPIDLGQALRITAQVCAGLAYAHEQGIVHRDIKPGNILLDDRGDAQIADFGIARVSGTGPDSGLTVTGSSMGTLLYMAPEQKLDATRCDARTDVFSLGVVLYEMLVGEVPEGRFEMPSERIPGIDRRVDAIIERAMRQAPEKRYSSATDMGRAVHEVLSSPASVSAAPPPPPPPPPRSPAPAAPTPASAPQPVASAPSAHGYATPPPMAGPVPRRRVGSVLAWTFVVLGILAVLAEVLAVWAVADPRSLDLTHRRTYRGTDWNDRPYVHRYEVVDEEMQLGVVTICAGFVLLAGVIFLIWLHGMWRSVPAHHRRITPGAAVGYLFIPLLNLIWIFRAVAGLSGALRRAGREVPAAGVGDAGHGLAVVACLLAVVPGIGRLLLVMWVPRANAARSRLLRAGG